MMKLSMGLKSALLTLVVLATVPVGTTSPAAPVAVSNGICAVLSQHKVKLAIGAILFAMHTRLHTRPRADFSMDDLKADFEELLDSLNIFDSKLYNQLVFLFDKYVIGLPVKIEEASKKYPSDEDGVSLSLKTKKLTQKPFGLYGYFDAYVLSQSKKFAESMAGAALLYVYFTRPEALWNGELSKVDKTLTVAVTVK